jgi:hypothetical protein
MDAEMKAALAEIGKKLDAVLAAVKGGAHAPSAATPTQAPPREKGSKAEWIRGTPTTPAPDSDLDGQHGDPVMKFNPKKWNGPSHAGKTYSEIPAECLLMLAEELEFNAANPFADAPPARPGYQRKDAARARGWAARPMPENEAPAAGVIGDDSDSIPF